MGRLSFALPLIAASGWALAAVAWSSRAPPPATPSPPASALVTSQAQAAAPRRASRPKLSAIERARSGELEAIKQLDKRPAAERSIEECIAISEGHAVLARRSVEQLGRDVKAEPALVADKTTMALVFRHAGDPLASPSALALAAELPGSVGPDLLYDVWKRPGHAPTQALAEDLLKVQSVREKADEPLDLLLRLEAETRCERLRTLVAQLRDKGDRRALPRLSQLARKTGCGKRQNEDCYECLRGDGLLRATHDAVQQRKPPRPWAIAGR
jgi:hypothetical protein